FIASALSALHTLSLHDALPISPRLGVSYKVTEKTVVRVGYGRGYSLGIFGAVFGHNVTQNLPVLAGQQVNPASNFQTVFTLAQRSEEHTSELQSRENLVCRLLL